LKTRKESRTSEDKKQDLLGKESTSFTCAKRQAIKRKVIKIDIYEMVTMRLGIMVMIISEKHFFKKLKNG
jgi:hypothetical protein